MAHHADAAVQTLPNGVMLNVYPDSIGNRLSDLVSLLQQPDFDSAFSLLYLLPTCFHSDLDRGFSVIDYDLNEELVTPDDLAALTQRGIQFKFDLVLNHLSVASPQFQDLLRNGDDSEYKDFFVDWNAFWHEHGEMGPDGHVIPDSEHLEKLFLRKPGLPILDVRFPDGTDRPYWNTFYQKVTYRPVAPDELIEVGVDESVAPSIAMMVNGALENGVTPDEIDLDGYNHCRSETLAVVDGKREYLGQMDLNARSERVWQFYDETLGKLKSYGAKIIRLDAFAYLHKEPGKPNFFNKPGTWQYLGRLRNIARQHDLIVFPEVHAEYGKELHEEVAAQGYPIYDFFFPGLVIDALEYQTGTPLKRWIGEIQTRGLETINMLGCHDGIPVLDLRGVVVDGVHHAGLLDDARIDAVMEAIINHGGRVKNLYGTDGKKIAYYQVNATFFSALGEDEQKLLLARAIQLFMPGIPQVWYLDLFAGRNDYAAADAGGAAGHKEINRTNLSMDDVREGLAQPVVRDQLALIRLRNTTPAFAGELTVVETADPKLELTWRNGADTATLRADLATAGFEVITRAADGTEQRLAFG
ncbi:glycosidase [Thiohalocapsa halophila]|uniref:Glycosidase n=1 Tax=Thiohalocapsa halophila TaxID=69359 RepID=A0ABS1CBW7_9GAMM|nr:glycosidase [Thiohalocapsa halophila]MBK1629403.1 glycosidase [Thiohalocapsa halophila]